MICELFLPHPPTVNSYYVKTRNGVFISKAGKNFRESVAESCIQQLGGFNPITEPIMVEVILYHPDKRKRDLDNSMKGLLDALTHAAIWDDDSLIQQLFIYRGQNQIVKEHGCKGACWVRISPAGPIYPVGYYP